MRATRATRATRLHSPSRSTEYRSRRLTQSSAGDQHASTQLFAQWIAAVRLARIPAGNAYCSC